MLKPPAMVDVLIAVALGAGAQAEMWWGSNRPDGDPTVTTVAAVAYTAALAFRSTASQVMIGMAFVVLLAQVMLGGHLTSTLSIAIASILMTFEVGVQLTRCRAVGWAVAYLAAAWLNVFSVEPSRVLEELVFAAVVVVALPLIAGMTLRDRREREQLLGRLNGELKAERERAAELAATSERTRIAMEMHDVVAHSVSLMVIQAGAARHLLARDPEQSRLALTKVETVGRESLHELRRVLGLMRGPDESSGCAPAPTLDDLDELVAQVTAAGLEVAVAISGTPNQSPPGLGVAAYRIVQEALTNALRHSGARSATVDLAWSAGWLDMTIQDDGRGPAEGATPGLGLLGMKERARSYGGTVSTDAAPTGGFSVRARLPLADSETEGAL